MSQGNLFAADPVHYGPAKTPGLVGWRREALCGVVFRVAGDIYNPPEPVGSSRLEFVTCERCIEIANGKTER